jgi:hypothetical protein
MNISERVQEVFKRFNVNLTVTEEPRTDLAEATLDNGTVIYTDADDFTEGAEAYIINDEGERIPLPPGDYTLNDGGVIVIADGGKVASVNKGGKEGADGKQPSKGKDAPAAEAPAKEAPADPAPSDPPPTKDPVKRTRTSEDEKEKDVMYVTKDEVEAMIAAALESLVPKEEEMSEEVSEKAEELSQEVAEEVTEEVAEEMSAVNPEAPKAEKVEEKVEEVEDEVAVELASVKAELEAIKKQAAEGGLKHAAPTKKVEPVNLKNLSTSERVSALLNQFSK